MRLTGNLRDIKEKRENKNQPIEIQVDQIEYLTHKKDGRYYQPFEFVDELDVPFVITGDCLARSNKAHLEEGEFEFDVYDKTGDAYVRNENKALFVTTVYDEAEQVTILSSVTYVVTVSNEAFRQIKTDRYEAKKGKSKRKK
ncbi:hypothetical protein [Pontibacter chitinilyticus]|uniref:hypothetical protein n=1 Tax=Pontibacter chitinilyticus TaxID=2674989 RepID=UPI00321A4339